VVFLDSEGHHVVGFAQLYPFSSSLSMKRTWILNDLFVSASARGHGVGTALLKECKQLAVETEAAGLALETMKGNLTAHRLYEACGWKRDDAFFRYNLLV
jgi:GNAT superfamily N-acetyltransferase